VIGFAPSLTILHIHSVPVIRTPVNYNSNIINVINMRCRKQYYSLNVQIISNETKKICNVVSRWAGSTHDARVWNNCNAKGWLNQQDRFLMCADSAYPISQKLIKPYFQPVDQHKKLFNRLLSGIRTVCTENVIALLKLRFPSLRLGLRTKIQNACDDVVAMVVLHNLSIIWGEPDPQPPHNLDPDEMDVVARVDPPYQNSLAIRAAGQQYRDWMSSSFCRKN